MEKVQILLSTYNGEKYLRQQLESLLNQTYTEIEVLIRDDGSTDDTVHILEEYAQHYHNITFYQGKNIGVIQSFMELLRKSSDEAAYYAFCDQDDEWMPEKIERAVKTIKDETKPALYCSETYLTDENLNVLHKDEKMARPSLGNALVQNICTGCTAVMNHDLRNIVKDTYPEHIVMHDWWFYLMASVYGHVYYDEEAYIKYRQHGNNEFGAKTSKKEIWKYRIGQLFQDRGELYDQLQEFERCCPDMDPEQKKLVELVLKARHGIKNRFRLITNKKIYRNKRMDDRVYRFIVLVGKL